MGAMGMALIYLGTDGKGHSPEGWSAPWHIVQVHPRRMVPVPRRTCLNLVFVTTSSSWLQSMLNLRGQSRYIFMIGWKEPCEALMLITCIQRVLTILSTLSGASRSTRSGLHVEISAIMDPTSPCKKVQAISAFTSIMSSSSVGFRPSTAPRYVDVIASAVYTKKPIF